MSRWLLVLLLLAVGGSALYSLVNHDAGYIFISLAGHTIETTFWFAVALLIGAGICIYAGLWILTAVGAFTRSGAGFFRSFNKSRNDKRYRLGLLHFFTGNLIEAVRQLSGAGGNLPVLRVLAVAEAEHRLGHSDTAIKHLLEAEKQYPDDRRWLASLRFQMLLKTQRVTEAEQLLRELRLAGLSDKDTLTMQVDLLQERAQWSEAIDLFSTIKKSNRWDSGESESREIQLHLGNLKALQKMPGLNTALLEQNWARVPRALKKQPILVAAYADLLFRLRQFAELEKLITQQLPLHWSDHLLRLYANLSSVDAGKQLKSAEAWLSQQRANPLLYLVKLAVRAQLSGKAKSYFQKSVDVRENSDAYRGLAELAEKQGHREESLSWYKKAALCDALVYTH